MKQKIGLSENMEFCLTYSKGSSMKANISRSLSVIFPILYRSGKLANLPISILLIYRNIQEILQKLSDSCCTGEFTNQGKGAILKTRLDDLQASSDNVRKLLDDLLASLDEILDLSARVRRLLGDVLLLSGIILVSCDAAWKPSEVLQALSVDVPAAFNNTRNRLNNPRQSLEGVRVLVIHRSGIVGKSSLIVRKHSAHVGRRSGEAGCRSAVVEFRSGSVGNRSGEAGRWSAFAILNPGAFISQSEVSEGHSKCAGFRSGEDKRRSGEAECLLESIERNQWFVGRCSGVIGIEPGLLKNNLRLSENVHRTLETLSIAASSRHLLLFRHHSNQSKSI